MKNIRGLLPIQNECRIQLEVIRKKHQIDLFPDQKSKESFFKNRKNISVFAKEKIDAALKRSNASDLKISETYVSIFCSKITQDELDYAEIQMLYDDALNELLGHFFGKNSFPKRWNSFLLEMAKNDATVAYILATCLAFGYESGKSKDRLNNVSMVLNIVHSMLLDTNFSEQISLASYDLAIEQASINASLKRIAIASMIIAMLAFIVSTSTALPPILEQFVFS